MRYAKLKILFQGLTISNFGVFRPIFGSEVSRWGFLRLRIRLESSKIRKSYQKYDFWQFFEKGESPAATLYRGGGCDHMLRAIELKLGMQT